MVNVTAANGQACLNDTHFCFALACCTEVLVHVQFQCYFSWPRENMSCNVNVNCSLQIGSHFYDYLRLLTG